MKKLAIVLFVSFVAHTANAANWVEVGSNPEKKIYVYVDTESISTQGNYKQGFYKLINIANENYSVGLSVYDCKSNPRRNKITYLTRYDLKGNVTYSGGGEGGSFSPVLPESIGKKEADFVCNF